MGSTVDRIVDRGLTARRSAVQTQTEGLSLWGLHVLLLSVYQGL